jgi:hypothetical protein
VQLSLVRPWTVDMALILIERCCAGNNEEDLAEVLDQPEAEISRALEIVFDTPPDTAAGIRALVGPNQR